MFYNLYSLIIKIIIELVSIKQTALYNILLTLYISLCSPAESVKIFSECHIFFFIVLSTQEISLFKHGCFGQK